MEAGTRSRSGREFVSGTTSGVVDVPPTTSVACCVWPRRTRNWSGDNFASSLAMVTVMGGGGGMGTPSCGVSVSFSVSSASGMTSPLSLRAKFAVVLLLKKIVLLSGK
jgi:hypothetical protein